MIGVLGAMQIEVDGLIAQLEKCKKNSVNGFSFFEGEYKGKQLVVCKCGIGKVAAAVATTLMICLYPKIDIVVNIGVAGGIYPSIRQGDVVISSSTVQHDWDGLLLKRGQVDGYDEVLLPCSGKALSLMGQVLADMETTYFSAVIASGDEFVSSKEKANWLYSEFNAYACDMESASINHACSLLNKEFIALRSISDNGDGTAEKDFLSFAQNAAKISIKAMLSFITLWV